MKAKRLRNGGIAYYWEPQKRDREGGFTIPGEALGTDYAAARDRVLLLNQHLDEWRAGRGLPKDRDLGARAGTVDWWIETYLRSTAFENLSERTKRDYRNTLNRLADLPTKLEAADGTRQRIGTLLVSSISHAAADKIYATLRNGGKVTRQANYVIDVARRAWAVVSRAHPGTFLIPVPGPDGIQRLVINPFEGMERTFSRNTTLPATRAEAFALADALTKLGHPAIGAVAIIAYEWLQRPENILSGHLTWPQYRPEARPHHVQIFHHKTGERIWQPLDDIVVDPNTNGETIASLYPELEAMLAQLPKLGVPIVMLQPSRGKKDASGRRPARLYSQSYAEHLVQEARANAGLGKHVTLAACRHGGMTLLGDAGITEQGVMALSGHRTPQAARIYVKRTEQQRLAAARQRRSYLESEGLAERKEGASGNGANLASGNAPPNLR